MTQIFIIAICFISKRLKPNCFNFCQSLVIEPPFVEYLKMTPNNTHQEVKEVEAMAKEAKVILDTNIMYYLCGLSQPPSALNLQKLKRHIRQQSNRYIVAISSISFYEFLVRYRKQAAFVRRSCSVLKSYGVRICNNPYLPVLSANQCDYARIRQSELSEVVNEVMPRKIDVESKFAAAIFLTVLISDITFEAFPDGIFNINTHKLLSDVAYADQTITVDYFKATYKAAYQQKEPENYVRNEFHQLLELLLPLGVALCKKLSYMTENDNLPDCFKSIAKEEWNTMVLSEEKKLKKIITPTMYVSKRSLQYGRSIKDTQLTDFFDSLSKVMERIHVEGNSVREYIFEIIKSIILNGSPFMKNDINDSMILSSVGSDDYLITCDNGMLKHMEKYGANRSEYNTSLHFCKDYLHN